MENTWSRGWSRDGGGHSFLEGSHDQGRVGGIFVPLFAPISLFFCSIFPLFCPILLPRGEDGAWGWNGRRKGKRILEKGLEGSQSLSWAGQGAPGWTGRRKFGILEIFGGWERILNYLILPSRTFHGPWPWSLPGMDNPWNDLWNPRGWTRAGRQLSIPRFPWQQEIPGRSQNLAQSQPHPALP